MEKQTSSVSGAPAAAVAKRAGQQLGKAQAPYMIKFTGADQVRCIFCFIWCLYVDEFTFTDL